MEEKLFEVTLFLWPGQRWANCYTERVRARDKDHAVEIVEEMFERERNSDPSLEGKEIRDCYIRTVESVAS